MEIVLDAGHLYSQPSVDDRLTFDKELILKEGNTIVQQDQVTPDNLII